MKRIFVILFLFFATISVSHANVGVVKTEIEPFYDKVQAVTKLVVEDSNNSANVEKYIKIMSLRATYFAKAKRDLASSADDLRSALYFASMDKGEKYEELKTRLDKTLVQMKYQGTDYENLELAKNLFYEGKYFASAYEFDELAKKGYEPYVCYEFLGDISQKIMQSKNVTINYYKKSLENYKSEKVYLKLAKMYGEKNETELENATYRALLQGGCVNDTILNEIITTYEKKDLKNSENLEILALCYEQKGDFASASRLISKAIEISPHDIFLKYSYAIMLHKNAHYDEAIKIYDEILKSNPYESQIRISKANCLLKLNKKDEAIKQFQYVLAIYKNSMQAQYALYKTLGGANMDEIVQKFYPLDKNFMPDSDFYLNLAQYAMGLDKTQDSVSFFKQAILKNPKNDKAYLGLYRAYEIEGKDALSYETIKKAYSNIPQNKEIQALYAKMNESGTSQKSELALMYFKQNDYKKAIAIYSQIEPKTVDIYVSMANAYKILKDYKRAKECLETALKLDVVNSDVYYNLAILYLEQNSPQSAKQMLVKAVNLNHTNVKALKLLNIILKREIDDILNYSYEFYAKGQYAQSETILTEAMKKYQDSPQLYYYRGLTYEAQKKYKNAILDYKKTLSLDKTYNLAYFSLATILDKSGEEKQALELYEKFLSGQVNDEALRKKAQDRALELGEKYY